MINHRKITQFADVDISIPVEFFLDGKYENIQYLLKNAARKSISQMDNEIEEAKKSYDPVKGKIIPASVIKILGIFPRKLTGKFLRMFMNNHKKIKEMSGSVFVTMVSMFSGARGFVIPYMGGPKASAFALGSTVKKPAVIKGEITVREYINLTAVFNHDIIDGAPAAGFINYLRKLVEKDYKNIV